MKSNTELHIVIPGICGPLAETHTLQTSQLIKKWTDTLSRASCYPAVVSYYEVLTEMFEIRVNEDFPSAALVLQANDMYDAALHYMHADPVHLRADLDHAVLSSSTDLSITEDESEALCDALNLHFNPDGLTFFRLDKDQWFVSSRDEIHLRTTSLLDATGRNVNHLLPAGEHSTLWKARLTEAQMLMHSHQVNSDREDSGQQSINSLWFHGSGEFPESTAGAISSVCSDHDLLKGLARHVRCDYLERPGSVNDYVSFLNNLNVADNDSAAINVLHMSDLEHLVNYTDVNIWLDKLADILDDWVYPLIKMANKNNIKIILYPCNGKQYYFSKYDALKFWRKTGLEQHINCHRPHA